jgi:hypothetical protein
MVYFFVWKRGCLNLDLKLAATAGAVPDQSPVFGNFLRLDKPLRTQVRPVLADSEMASWGMMAEISTIPAIQFTIGLFRKSLLPPTLVKPIMVFSAAYLLLFLPLLPTGNVFLKSSPAVSLEGFGCVPKFPASRRKSDLLTLVSMT